MFKKSIIIGNCRIMVVISKHIIVAPKPDGGIVLGGFASPEACKEVLEKFRTLTNDVLRKAYGTIGTWLTNMPEEVRKFPVNFNDNSTITIEGMERACIVDGVLYFVNMTAELVDNGPDEYISFSVSIDNSPRD